MNIDAKFAPFLVGGLDKNSRAYKQAENSGYTAPLYLKPKSENQKYELLTNDQLSQDSRYHYHLEALMTCVKHSKGGRTHWSEEDAQAACGKEFKALKATTIRGSLKYPFVMEKYFQNESMKLRNERGHN